MDIDDSPARLALDRLAQQCTPASFLTSLATLMKINSNLLKSGDPKYRRLNLANEKLVAKLGSDDGQTVPSGAILFLEALGFRPTEADAARLEMTDEDRTLVEFALSIAKEVEGEHKTAARKKETNRAAERAAEHDDEAVPEYDIRDCRTALEKLKLEVKQAYESIDEREEQLLKLVGTLERIVKNCLREDAENSAKYRTLDVVKLHFDLFTGAGAVLTFMGFVAGSEGEENRWHLPAENEHQLILQRAQTMLQRFRIANTSSEEEKLCRHAASNPPQRRLRVFDLSVPPIVEMIDAPTRGETKLVMQAMKQERLSLKMKHPDVIVTRTRRAEEKEKRRRKYEETIIRVVLGGEAQVMLQAWFSPYERLSRLFEFFSEHLTPNGEFLLKNPPLDTFHWPGSRPEPQGKHARGKRARESNPTLLSLSLVPGATLQLTWANGQQHTDASLKPSILQLKETPTGETEMPKAINLAQLKKLRDKDLQQAGLKTEKPKKSKSKREKKMGDMMARFGFADD